ncbi:ABC transporter ATP-binding protein [Thermodesulfovibrionales bacterium]|nr:ABC transporter ATP-binding protein [Thermodesulfovibrionales bacterium]
MFLTGIAFMEVAIKVENLCKYYSKIKAVDGVSFEVFKGEIFGIVGPNGAGKTTLVECITGLKFPDKGTIEILGLNPQKKGKTLRQRIGIQLQEGRLPGRIKVREAINLFAAFYFRSVPWRPLLEDCGLSEKADSYFDALSGGQKQRLFIAMSLINDPEIVFFDELSTGLDPQARRAMWSLTEKIRDMGKTVILVTHFMEEAERLCDRVAVIDKGRIIAMDTPVNLIVSLNMDFQIVFSTNGLSTINEIEEIDGIDKVEKNGAKTVIHCKNNIISDVISFLTRNDIQFYDLSIRRPNLEDLFLSLTGRSMRD